MTEHVILAVDDELNMRLLISEVFTAEGYRVVTAASGEEALELMQELVPDIILLDIMMPGIDGFEVCSRVKQLPGHENTPVIMLTGLDDVKAIKHAYEVGAWDFMSKPIKWPVLVYRVRYALRASHSFSIEQKSARLSRAIDSSPSEVLLFDATSMKVESANASALANLGYQLGELRGLDFAKLAVDIPGIPLREQLQQLNENQQVNLTFTMSRKDGSSYPAEGIVLYSAEEKPHVYIGIFQDITERKNVENELHRLAFFDDLTGLPNRRMLQEHVVEALTVAKAKNTRCALCLLDLDGFKAINDTLGHSVGDLLLKEVAHRLSSILRQEDIVSRDSVQELSAVSGTHLARLGGDEFLMLITDFTDADVPAKVMNRVLRQIAMPYHVHKTELNLTGSVGIALYPNDGDSLDVLMKYADTAMYKAKHCGKNNYSFYSKEADDSSLDRLVMQAQLRLAVENNELELHYQPLVDGESMQIVGAEALLRWRHGSEELRFPDEFIPLAEETGMILPIGEWVMRAAIEQAEEWTQLFSNSFSMAVNVSGYQVRQDSFQHLTRQLLDEHPAVRNNLVIELTESTLMSSAQSHISWLHEIRDMGVKVAIDDFGTGYSSLSYLKKFPINSLKVDRSFVEDIDTDKEDAAIVNAIFSMAQALGLDITVEGVETLTQLGVIKKMGHCQVQGWLIGKAMPATEFEAFLLNYTAALSPVTPIASLPTAKTLRLITAAP